jgi:hypothetical protein
MPQKHRKCDSQKYRRRRLREQANKLDRRAEEARRKAIWDKAHPKLTEDERYRWRGKVIEMNDPTGERHVLEQRLVNILYLHLSQNPVYKMQELVRTMRQAGWWIDPFTLTEEPADNLLPGIPLPPEENDIGGE